MATGRVGGVRGTFGRAIIEHRVTVSDEVGGHVAMEAGPRDRRRRDQRATPDDEPPDPPGLATAPVPDAVDIMPGDGTDPVTSPPVGGSDDGAGPGRPADDVPPAGPPDEEGPFRELRPQRRLRFWQIIPIAGFGTLGSLMFAFPLAFEFSERARVIALLGLLLCCCAAGWGILAARRVGYTWPGLPVRGSGARPDWRFVAGYTVLLVLLVLLAVWRVARLR